jgi:hypothetical protein
MSPSIGAREKFCFVSFPFDHARVHNGLGVGSDNAEVPEMSRALWLMGGCAARRNDEGAQEQHETNQNPESPHTKKNIDSQWELREGYQTTSG